MSAQPRDATDSTLKTNSHEASQQQPSTSSTSVMPLHASGPQSSTSDASTFSKSDFPATLPPMQNAPSSSQTSSTIVLSSSESFRTLSTTPISSSSSPSSLSTQAAVASSPLPKLSSQPMEDVSAYSYPPPAFTSMPQQSPLATAQLPTTLPPPHPSFLPSPFQFPFSPSYPTTSFHYSSYSSYPSVSVPSYSIPNNASPSAPNMSSPSPYTSSSSPNESPHPTTQTSQSMEAMTSVIQPHSHPNAAQEAALQAQQNNQRTFMPQFSSDPRTFVSNEHFQPQQPYERQFIPPPDFHPEAVYSQYGQQPYVVVNYSNQPTSAYVQFATAPVPPPQPQNAKPPRERKRQRKENSAAPVEFQTKPNRPPAAGSLLRTETFKGVLQPSGAEVAAVLEGAPDVGFLVEFTIKDKIYKGFVLNSDDFKPTLNFGHKRKGETTQSVSKEDLTGANELVETGRAVVINGTKDSPSSTSDKKKDNEVWQCYSDTCKQRFSSSEELTNHIKTHHSSNLKSV